MCVSMLIMLLCEYSVYLKHIKPLNELYKEDNPAFHLLENAFHTIHTFPVLTVKRILGPHLLGLSLPASLLALIFIKLGYLDFPIYFIGLAWMGALLVAVMHALIEFFLTYRSIVPVVTDIIKRSEAYGKKLSLPLKNLITIKGKLIYSSVFIAVFPILGFILASGIQLNQTSSGDLSSYWKWAVTDLAVIVSLAAFSSLLLYENINKPIEVLKQRFTKVEEGHMDPIVNIYLDEYATLVTGFNTMVKGIKDRDQRNDSLLESFYTVFAATLDARDPYTAGHSNRVAEFSVLIGEKAELDPTQIDLLKKSSLLHDIGKIGVRDAVLLKEGRLTDEEFEQIKLHPVIGANILEQVNLPNDLKPLLPGVKYHHERYDGKGYPEGLKGEEIPLFVRIMAVADAYDAMTSDRPYRKGMPVEKALSILEDGKGTQWDPHFVDLFIFVMKNQTSEKRIS
ncbi:HD-GYP domain-containing protein [Peribacillus deserti]